MLEAYCPSMYQMTDSRSRSALCSDSAQSSAEPDLPENRAVDSMEIDDLSDTDPPSTVPGTPQPGDPEPAALVITPSMRSFALNNRVFSGYTLAERAGNTRSWVYNFGILLQHTENKDRRFVCGYCLQARKPRPASYSDRNLNNAQRHLARSHGCLDPSGRRQAALTHSYGSSVVSIADQLQLQGASRSAANLVINHHVVNFDKRSWQRRLIAWIVKRNQPFSVTEDPEFRDMINDLNPSVLVQNALLTGNAVRDFIAAEYEKHKATVKQVLKASFGKVRLPVTTAFTLSCHTTLSPCPVYNDFPLHSVPVTDMSRCTSASTAGHHVSGTNSRVLVRPTTTMMAIHITSPLAWKNIIPVKGKLLPSMSLTSSRTLI